MPGRTGTKRKYAKKIVAKKRTRKKKGEAPLPQTDMMAQATMGKSIGFPSNKKVILKYVERFPLESSAGVLGTYQFVCNGLYDPNITASGHQPYGRDQWALFYNHYRVTHSRIKVTAVHTAPSAPAMVVGLYTSDDISILSNSIGLIESGRDNHFILNNDTSSKKSIYADFSAYQFFGKDKSKYLTNAAVGTNPGEIAVFTVWAQSLDSVGIASPTADFLVEIDYHVVFMEPKDLLQS